VRAIRPGNEVRVLDANGRLRHGIIVEVTDQDTITVKVGHNEAPFDAVRATVSGHRAEQFEHTP
jgi:hypothetical protein